MTKPTLLVLDDEPGIAEFIADVAQSRGFQVSTTTSISDFQEAFLGARPDAIISDFAIPGTDGEDILRWLGEQEYRNPVVLMSGHGAEFLETLRPLAESQNLDLAEVLGKPTRLADLLDVLERIRP